MRLINVNTFRLEEYIGQNIPRYAILSHTWVDGEISFTEFETPEAQDRASNKPGYSKIWRSCHRAKIDGYKYVWVDTVCIDKRSSSELTEAINSMFEWYQKAHLCYVYLSDVSGAEFQMNIPQSRWFTRGWTLQELLAPPQLIFLDQDFNVSCSIESVVDSVSRVTGIDKEVLDRGSILRVQSIRSSSIAKRMSWAAHRNTTRIEDRAYSLLGIFGISMPLLYGEGMNAFKRLQEEIIKTSDDHSIFAWSMKAQRTDFKFFPSSGKSWKQGDYFAPSPSNFAKSGDIEPMERDPSRIGSTMITNRGLQICLPIFREWPNIKTLPERFCQIALLNCRRASDCSYVAMMLFSGDQENEDPRDSEIRYHRFLFHKFSEGITEATILIDSGSIWKAKYRTAMIENITAIDQKYFCYPNGKSDQICWTLSGSCDQISQERYDKWYICKLQRLDVLTYSLGQLAVKYPVDLKGLDHKFKLQGRRGEEPTGILMVFSNSDQSAMIEVVLWMLFEEGPVYLATRTDGSGGRHSTDSWLRGISTYKNRALLEGSATALQVTEVHADANLKYNIKVSKRRIMDQYCTDIRVERVI